MKGQCLKRACFVDATLNGPQDLYAIACVVLTKDSIKIRTFRGSCSRHGSSNYAEAEAISMGLREANGAIIISDSQGSAAKMGVRWESRNVNHLANAIARAALDKDRHMIRAILRIGN